MISKRSRGNIQTEKKVKKEMMERREKSINRQQMVKENKEWICEAVCGKSEEEHRLAKET